MPCDRHRSNRATRGRRLGSAAALVAALASWAGGGILHAQDDLDAGEIEIREAETRDATEAAGAETRAAVAAAGVITRVEARETAEAPAAETQDQDVEAAEVEEPQPLPPISVGGGLQSSFLHHRSNEADASDHLRVNSLRLYLNGSATDTIKFMVNTDIDYGGSLGAPEPRPEHPVQDPRRGRAVRDVGHVQRVGGTVPAA